MNTAPAIRHWRRLGLKLKIFFTTVGVVLLISAAIALLARWILVSTLTDELKLRGLAIAQSIADRANGLILDKDIPQLVSLAFDTAQLSERRHLIAYIHITDAEGHVLAHTFTRPFPEELRTANPLPPGRPEHIRALTVFGRPVYDIAVPVSEGLYRVGAVHVGLNKERIDSLVGKLRITFLGFISLTVVIIFVISLRLAGTITRPLSRLMAISDEVSRGNFDVQPVAGELSELLDHDWQPTDCPAYRNTDLPCWHLDQAGNRPHGCAQCAFYRRPHGDEVSQLAESFRNMVWSIRLYRRRLRESEEKYRSLFDSGPDPVIVAEHETLRILDANLRAEELYGYSRAELTALSFADLDPDFRALCAERLSGSEGGCVYGTKVIHYKKGGLPFFVNLHACPISYKGIQAVIVAATDITEIIEKDAQLIQASKMKTLGEMSAGIAHELNQPLNAIKMGSDFLAMVLAREAASQPPAAVVSGVVAEMSAQVDRATEIINTLRAFGRKTGLIKQQLDLNEPVRGVLNIVGQQFRLQNVDIRLQLAQGLPPIQAHDNRLQQVIFNLVTNARDAILAKHAALPPGDGAEPAGQGHIDIRSYADDGRVCLQVADSGTGIAEDDLHKVFEPFYTTKATGQGMGLGLSISYGIVKDYGGDIHIRSVVGQGTTFTLSFPAQRQTPLSAPQA